jgi:CrcB protein
MIALGGALGAIARYQVGSMIQSRLASGFPWGTFVVNISGCFLMGAVAVLVAERGAASPNWRFFIPIGFIGAYTTFSTFEFETYQAVGDGAWIVASGNVAASVIAGYAALWLGAAMTRFVLTGAR